ncbi:hypothetical protein HY570_01565 [Candidatus Micrarchaeota archaeon]|nr:hypothetical protein [Candidatus Micrarchaeota archaeon]
MQAQKKEQPKLLPKVEFSSYLLEGEKKKEPVEAVPKSEGIMGGGTFEDVARREYEKSVKIELKSILAKKSKKKKGKKNKKKGK